MKTQTIIRGLAAGLALALPGLGHAQVGIGTATPSAKAALEIAATNKGLLIPRLTGTQRVNITSVPQGLLVYQTDAPEGFWYYGGGSWLYLNPSAALTLPYAGSSSSNSTSFAVTNAGPGVALSGAASNSSFSLGAVVGQNTNGGGAATGVLGLTPSGFGVRGVASASGGYGVQGQATDGRGLSGSASSGTGVYGTSATGVAVQGEHTTGDRGRAAEFTNADAANDSTAVYISTPGDRPALRAVNTATSAQAAIRGVKQSASIDGVGVEGVITAGASGSAAAVRGLDNSGGGGSSGLLGLTANGYGVRGVASAAGGYGVSGSATSGYGVVGGSTSGIGVYGSTSSGSAAVQGTSSNNTLGQAAVIGQNTSNGGAATGVLGLTASGYGVRGVASASGGYGVQGIATDSYAVTGTSTSGNAIYGTTGGAAVAGVLGNNNTGYGVRGTTNTGYGVRGEATGASAYGLYGLASGGTAYGVYGQASGTGSYGVFGNAPNGTGVQGNATGNSYAGVLGYNLAGYGLRGISNTGIGASGESGTGYGLFGQATDGIGAYAIASGTGRAGVFTQTNAATNATAVEINGTGTGTSLYVKGTGGGNNPVLTLHRTGNPSPPVGTYNVYSSLLFDYDDPSYPNSNFVDNFSLSTRFGSYSVFSLNRNGNSFLSYSTGNMVINSGLDVTGITRVTGSQFYVQNNAVVNGQLNVNGSKNFQIDHPLDPAHKYLYHSCIESPDMMNVYNGNATLDAQGAATVPLPTYFEALNRDFRYQLTPLGAPGPSLYVAQEVAGNQFRIAGGTPGGRVSWQVTGIRQDKAADKYRTVPEVDKEPENQGRYLLPEAYGQDRSQTIGRQSRPAQTQAEAAKP